MQRNCFTCHQAATTRGAGLVNWQLHTGAEPGVQRSCWQLPQADAAVPGAPRTWSSPEYRSDTVQVGGVQCLVLGSGISLQRRCSGWCQGACQGPVSVRGCFPLPPSPCLWRGWKMGLSSRVLMEVGGFCLLSPGGPVPSSMSFTLCSHSMGSRRFSVLLRLLIPLSCAFCTNQKPSSCGWPSQQLWSCLPTAVMLSARCRLGMCCARRDCQAV